MESLKTLPYTSFFELGYKPKLVYLREEGIVVDVNTGVVVKKVVVLDGVLEHMLRRKRQPTKMPVNSSRDAFGQFSFARHRIDLVARMYFKENIKVKDIMKMLNIKRQTVYTILRRVKTEYNAFYRFIKNKYM